MTEQDDHPDDPPRTNRRTALTLLGVVGVGGLAGCFQGGDESTIGPGDTPTDTPDDTPTPTDTSTPTDTPTPTATDTPTPTDTPTSTPTDTPSSPTAEFSASPMTATPGEEVTVDASASSDPDGSIASYEWEFGDGGTATGQTASRAYDTEGSYDVALTVTDDDGLTDTATTTIEVAAQEGLDPATTIEFETRSNSAWTGVAPAAIEGENPTLQLQEGEEYTLEWTNENGGVHNFVIETDGGSTPVSTEFLDTEGGTQTVTFTASAGMIVYYCSPHRGLGMEGDIEIV